MLFCCVHDVSGGRRALTFIEVGVEASTSKMCCCGEVANEPLPCVRSTPKMVGSKLRMPSVPDDADALRCVTVEVCSCFSGRCGVWSDAHLMMSNTNPNPPLGISAQHRSGGSDGAVSNNNNVSNNSSEHSETPAAYGTTSQSCPTIESVAGMPCDLAIDQQTRVSSSTVDQERNKIKGRCPLALTNGHSQSVSFHRALPNVPFNASGISQ